MGIISKQVFPSNMYSHIQEVMRVSKRENLVFLGGWIKEGFKETLLLSSMTMMIRGYSGKKERGGYSPERKMHGQKGGNISTRLYIQ